MKKLLLLIFIFVLLAKAEAQVNLTQTNLFSSQNFKLKKHHPKKYKSILKTNIHYENWFHIGIGASGFTYFLWVTDMDNTYWIDEKKPPYIGFSYMPEVTIQFGNRISWYISLGWTGMSEFENMWQNKQSNTIPPTNIDRTPVVAMTGISFGIYGYEGTGYGNTAKDIYLSPARISIGTGFGNFQWENEEYVSGVVAVISLEWYLFMLNMGGDSSADDY